ncbi:SURF1 family protein [Piscinibacter sp.]|uniref:SURF1 family protein n=1 Tax=Piscinibacter sp. TaxID=1903157 RepID=UPI0039E31C49
MNTRARRLVVLAAALAGVALTARLGVWQLSRAAEKEAMQAALLARGGEAPLAQAELARTHDAAEAQRHRRIVLQGRWIGGRTIFLDNRPMDGRAGFYVVTPLALEGGEGDAVLVQRGWVPRDAADRTRVPELASPGGVVRIEGRIAAPPSRTYELGAEGQGAIRQNLDLDAFARETGLRLRPLSVQQADGAGAAADGLLRHWPAPALDVHKHYGYAFQWFALAALISGLYVWFQLVRPRLARRA